MPAVEDIFKALGDPTRVRIVQMLARNGEMCVCYIMEELGMTQPAVSHHLAALKHAGLVRGRKEGQWVHYSLCCAAIADPGLKFLQDILETRRGATDASACALSEVCEPASAAPEEEKDAVASIRSRQGR